MSLKTMCNFKEEKLNDEYSSNKNLKMIALNILIYSRFPFKEFSALDEQSKLTIFIFLIKRNLMFIDVNKKTSLSLFDDKMIKTNISLHSKHNRLSLMETMLNKIFRKCFNHYISKLNQNKLLKFISKSRDSIRNVNKVFWYLFYDDCKPNESTNLKIQEFNIFFKEFCSKKQIDRKNIIKKSKKHLLTYSSLVLRISIVKKWFNLIKNNKFFRLYFSKSQQEILEEYLNLRFEKENLSGYKKEKGPYQSLNLQEKLEKCIKEIQIYQQSKKFKINPHQIRNDLKSVKCPFILNDYLTVFSLI